MLKIVQTDLGVFDLAFDDPALNDEDAAVATLVYAALFTDTEAPVDRIPDRFNRRGWWADPAIGNGLWYVRRQPLGSAARAETLAMITDSLSIRAPGLTNIQVTDVSTSAGNISSVVVQITGLHNGRQFLVKAPL
jgi:phage gp46-like protein